mmetsp:Transcript_10371/g.18340  ORF Transcript_10371/g.18340 Transcript_10371/m.18340 type:complete len:218 (-) Transcript_10371:1-654(-)
MSSRLVKQKKRPRPPKLKLRPTKPNSNLLKKKKPRLKPMQRRRPQKTNWTRQKLLLSRAKLLPQPRSLHLSRHPHQHLPLHPRHLRAEEPLVRSLEQHLEERSCQRKNSTPPFCSCSRNKQNPLALWEGSHSTTSGWNTRMMSLLIRMAISDVQLIKQPNHHLAVFTDTKLHDYSNTSKWNARTRRHNCTGGSPSRKFDYSFTHNLHRRRHHHHQVQ